MVPSKWSQCIRSALLSPLLRRTSEFVLVLLATTTVACNSAVPVSVRDLCILPKEQFGTMNGPAVVNWVKSTYSVQPGLTQQTDGPIKLDIYYWTSGGVNRDAMLRDDRLVLFSQREMQHGARLSQIVDALGAPGSLYSFGRVFEGVEYTLWLEYPTKGVSVGVIRVAHTEETKRTDGLEILLSPDMELTHVDCYAPVGSTDELLRTVYRVPADQLERQKQRRVTWPGFGVWVPLE